MKNKLQSCFIIFILCSIAFPVLAEYKLQTPDGKTVLLKDDGTWEQVPSETKNATDYQLMDIVDFIVDNAKLAGTKVKISGMGKYFGGSFTLRRETMDLNMITVDIKSLPRDQMKTIIANSDYWRKVIVYGTVGKVIEASSENGIIAEKVEWK
jgi:hypothetical protein